MKLHGSKPPEYCTFLSQINTHTIKNPYSIYPLAVGGVFYENLFFCATKIISSVFISVDGECGQLYI